MVMYITFLKQTYNIYKNKRKNERGWKHALMFTVDVAMARGEFFVQPYQLSPELDPEGEAPE